MKPITDNFSKGAEDYAAFRPGSPEGIFDFLYGHIPGSNAAWDCGTGNGQVALQLAKRFTTVFATDISEEQLKYAPKKDNIIYRKERSEQTSLTTESIDLITAAQAIHWFDFGSFYKEVSRVARPGAVFAAWTYTLLQVTPAIDELIRKLYADITGPYWDTQRSLVDNQYKTLPFPFRELPAPSFSIHKELALAQLAGYLRTWSGVQHYLQQEQKDPVNIILKDMEKAWGSALTMPVVWPVYIRAGVVK